MVEVLLILLLIFMIISSVIAVNERSLLSSVVALGASGFALTVIFFLLRAPDVAITQLIAEVLILIVLIRATGVRQDITESQGGRAELFSVFSVIAFIFVFSLFSVIIFYGLPKFGQPFMDVSSKYIEYGLDKTGAANMVSSILLDYRGYDTLGEATVLFAAIVGVLTLLRRKGRKMANERDDEDS
ncbi:MAG: DUF4040 domain-containing protein [Candidatus Saganbacteria bacterium]|nr:DUF4040 domain-containing protein [Candidatus Saganbacteria bacterium]